jgi:hypothetical protein
MAEISRRAAPTRLRDGRDTAAGTLLKELIGTKTDRLNGAAGKNMRPVR